MNVFALPPGADFVDDFARGYHSRYGSLPGEVRARTRILVNSGRAGSLIETALADYAPAPGILPRVSAIPDLGLDPVNSPDIPAPLSALRRQLRLTRLVEHYLRAKQGRGERTASIGAAAELATSLAELIDQFHDSGANPDRMDSALTQEISDKAALHWQDTLSFVDLVRKAWPAIRKQDEAGRLDPRARQRAVIEELVSKWTTEQPESPIIAAASTGSVGSTASLMAAIARLPGGVIVLPGFDCQVDPSIWQSSGADHPMGPFKNLLDQLGMTPRDVCAWLTPSQDTEPRRRLIAQALRPAPVTDHWHAAAGEMAAVAEKACDGLAVLEAPTPRHEAAAIAAAVREALEVPERRVSVITPDAALARRISAALIGFGIKPDDIMGQPLELTPPGILAQLVLQVAQTGQGPVPIAAMLQHPLVHCGLPRLQHLDLARGYQRKVLRHTGQSNVAQILPLWPCADAAAEDWLACVHTALSPLRSALVSGAPLSDIITTHSTTLEALTQNPGHPVPEIWRQEAGEAFRTFFDGLVRDADAFGAGPVTDYPALLAGLMRGETLRSRPREPHRRVALRGAREARLENADLTILAGLNDGTWPAMADTGPWLSRPMYEALGLPVPEREIGLSAHDFLCGICRREVLLTRSLRVDGAPTVASRWLIRLETLLTGIGAEEALGQAKKRGARFTAISNAAGLPREKLRGASRPAPVIRPSARPDRLSITRIETLIRDAYAVYAETILGLRPIEPLGRRPDARERGTVLHKVMELYAKRTVTWPGPDAAETILMQTADEVLLQDVPWPDLRRVWRARIGRFARWFVEDDAGRRAITRPIALEARGQMTIQLPGGPLTLSARADRIDVDKNGRALVIDYKSGAPPTVKQIDAGFNHQLHIQAAILACAGFENMPQMQAAAGAYIGLTGVGPGGRKTEIELDEAAVADHMVNVHRLLSAYDNGAPCISHGRPRSARYSGDYDHLARKAEWMEEEE